MKLLGRKIKSIINGKLRHTIRFGIVGICNTLVDFLCFTVLQSFVGLNYLVSQILGYCCGILNSFVLNKRWTFRDRASNKRSSYELLQFLIVNVITLAITLKGMKLLVNDYCINVYISKIIITIIAQITNYVGYKLWVFSPERGLKRQLHW